ncbi:MAG: HAD-IG family 5'-nucleotidase [Myxococcaceae bacterium]
MEPLHGAVLGVSDQAKVHDSIDRASKILGDDKLLRLLDSTPGHQVPHARQMFVNRNLHMSNVKLVGFDMDYTLAIYHHRALEELSFRMTVDKLIASFGYTEQLKTIKYDGGFVMRGLFVDKREGNLLKIDRYGSVGRAYHGRRQLTEAELTTLYRNERIRLKNPEYAWIDTLFALPEASLFADAIELLEKTAPGGKLDYAKLYDDIREAIDTVHRDNSLKAVIKQDLGKYIYKDPELGPALHRLRSGGKHLFVLTNSLFDYTDAVMKYLLDGVLPEYPSWRNYFDIVVTGARKPGFFSDHNPFIEIDASLKELGPAETFERGKLYQGGNLSAFERMSGHAGEAVLYVGDHIYGDILKSKKTSMWRTCMIVQEIEDELEYIDSRRSETEKLADLEFLLARIDDELSIYKAQLNAVDRRLERETLEAEPRAKLEDEKKRVKADLDKLRKAYKECTEICQTLEVDVERGFNGNWGLLFKEGNENSRFGEQVESYACIYTSRVSNFVFYSPLQYFRSPRALLPHEQTGVRLSPFGSEGLPKGTNRAE